MQPLSAGFNVGTVLACALNFAGPLADVLKMNAVMKQNQLSLTSGWHLVAGILESDVKFVWRSSCRC